MFDAYGSPAHWISRLRAAPHRQKLATTRVVHICVQWHHGTTRATDLPLTPRRRACGAPAQCASAQAWLLMCTCTPSAKGRATACARTSTRAAGLATSSTCTRTCEQSREASRIKDKDGKPAKSESHSSSKKAAGKDSCMHEPLTPRQPLPSAPTPVPPPPRAAGKHGASGSAGGGGLDASAAPARGCIRRRHDVTASV